MMKLSVTMFNEFVMKYLPEEGGEEKVVDLSSIGKELQNLLQLLLANRKKHMSKDKLIDLLYPDRKDPAGCLKYAVFRLRAFLKEAGDLNLVVTDSAGYTINPEYECRMDTEEFEELCQSWQNASSDEERSRLMAELTALYKGYFYLTPSQMLWAVENREYYHNRFCSIAVSQGEDDCLKERYEAAIALCEKLLDMDPFCEDMSCVFLKALVGDRQYIRAVNYYKNLTKQYMDRFGEPPSQKLRRIFHLITTDSISDKLSIDNAQKVFLNETIQKKAFFCNYDIFAHIVQLESRKLMRDTGDQIQLLIMMELTNAVNEEASQVWMEHLKECIQNTLRLGDVFTRANRKQFFILALCREVSNVEVIKERIEKAFYSSPKYRLAKLRAEVTELVPYDKIGNITEI